MNFVVTTMHLCVILWTNRIVRQIVLSSLGHNDRHDKTQSERERERGGERERERKSYNQYTFLNRDEKAL